MPLILYLILFLLLASSWLQVWLLFKLLPEGKQEEAKKAVLKVVTKNEVKVMEWVAPETPEKEEEKRILSELNLNEQNNKAR